MKRTTFTTLLIGLMTGAVLFGGTAGVLRAQNDAPPAGSPVATIDVVLVFNEYQRQKDLSEEFREKQTSLQAEDQSRRQKIDAAQATLDQLDPTDPAAVTRARELLQMKIEYRNWADLAQADLERELGLWTARVYQEILSATGQVAESRGHQVVLYRDEFQPLSDPQRIREQIQQRKVVYASGGTDISQRVLERLNTEYRKQPRAKMLQVP